MVAASDALAAKLLESDESLETVRAEVALLKEQVARVDKKKADYDKFVAEVGKDSKQLFVRLSVVLVGRNRAEKLKLSLVTESANAVDAVVQLLG